MKNTWDEEVEEHDPEDCYPCYGSSFYKLPTGCGQTDDPEDECEDEDNCYCDCHTLRAGQTESR